MGNSLLCHYIDNCFKKGKILWGQKHCDWGGKVEEWGAVAPVTMLKKVPTLTASNHLGGNYRAAEIFKRKSFFASCGVKIRWGYSLVDFLWAPHVSVTSLSLHNTI